MSVSAHGCQRGSKPIRVMTPTKYSLRLLWGRERPRAVRLVFATTQSSPRFLAWERLRRRAKISWRKEYRWRKSNAKSLGCLSNIFFKSQCTAGCQRRGAVDAAEGISRRGRHATACGSPTLPLGEVYAGPGAQDRDRRLASRHHVARCAQRACGADGPRPGAVARE